MGERRADFGENLNWDLVSRGVYQNPMRDPSNGLVVAGQISPVSFDLSTPYIVIGCESQAARPTWFLGCRANVRLKVRPSSTSSYNMGIDVLSKPCGLFRLTMVTIPPEVNPRPYSLVLTFPKWMPSIFIEIWQYSLLGLNENLELAALNRIEQRLADRAYDVQIEP